MKKNELEISWRQAAPIDNIEWRGRAVVVVD